VGPPPSASIPQELKEAIAWVADPRLEIGLQLGPPDGVETLRFYRGFGAETGALVGQRMDDAGNCQFVWTSEEELTCYIVRCLQSEAAVGGGDLALDLDATEFQTFLGLVDVNRERILRSLLDRVPSPERGFTAETVFEGFERGRRSEDQRWLVPLGRTLCPFPFRLTRDECEESLGRLAKRGFLKACTGRWVCSPVMRMISAALGSPLACCALQGRQLVAPGHWERDQLMLLRGLGSLCFFQFQQLDTPQPRVLLRDSSGEEADLVLSGRFQEWRRPRRPSAKVPSPAPLVGCCPACGKMVAPEAHFCAGCGNSLLSAQVPIRHCPSCQAVVASAPFCARCGTRLGEDERSPRVCPNPACHQPLREGKRFCLHCGQEVSPVAPPPATPSLRYCGNSQCPQYGQPVTKKFCTGCGKPPA
jgi:hypothetical protein